MLLTDWNQILDNILPDESSETLISEIFVRPLINALGFNDKERFPQFSTGHGTVDFAVRKNTNSDIFLFSKTNPYLLVEVEARATGAGANINLSEGTPQYINTREQIKNLYLILSVIYVNGALLLIQFISSYCGDMEKLYFLQLQVV